MTQVFPGTGVRPHWAARLAVSVAALTLLAAGPAAASTSEAAVKDDGRRSFGVQPAGPKKPDPRPNFTYRDVRPGQQLNDHVAFVNVSDKPVTLTVYAADGYNTEAGAFDLLAQGKPSRDLGSWVKLKRNRAVVPARSALVTPIVITVPRNAEPGDHAGGIVASLKTLAKDSKGNTVTVDQRVGTRMYIRVAGKLNPAIELERKKAVYHGPSNPLARGDADVTYTIHNTGNVRLVGTQTIRVSDVFGSSKQAIQVPEMPELLPGGSFTFTTKVRKVLPTLMLTAHVTIDPRSVTGNVDPAMEQANASARFWAIYWPAVIVLLFAIGEGARRWWLHRRRRASGPGAGGSHDGFGPQGGGDGQDANGGEVAEGDRVKAASMTPRTASAPRALRIVSAALIAVAASAAVLLTGAPAQAASDPAGLTFIPAKGQDISPLYAVTSAPCPAESTNLLGRMYGNGFPADGTIVIPNSDAALKHDIAFGVPLQDTLSSFAAEAGVKLKGKYKITLQCVNELATQVFKEFSGTLTFADPAHFTAPAPKTPPADGVPVGFLAQVFPEFKAGAGPSVTATAAPGASASPGASAPAALGDAKAAAQSTNSSSTTSSSVTPFLVILLGVAVIGAVGFVATRRRAVPGGSAGAGSATSVEWPDDDEGKNTSTPDKAMSGPPDTKESK